MGVIMINNLDDITDAIEDVIDHTQPLLRNRQLFYAAVEMAFFNSECENRCDMQKRISERVKHGIELLNNM